MQDILFRVGITLGIVAVLIVAAMPFVMFALWLRREK